MIDLEDGFSSSEIYHKSDSNTVCYLIHGFTSSTEEVRYLAEFLHAQGYSVKTENLPGHGTTAADCNRIKYSDWLEHVEQNFAELAAQYEKIFVLGTSMGGVLALHLASVFPINGVITGAATFRFNNDFRIRYFNPFLCNFIPKLKKKGDRNSQEKFKYSSYPMKALREFVRMNRKIEKSLPKIQVPALIQYAQNDKQSPPINVTLIHQNIRSLEKQIVAYKNSSHNLWFDENRHLLFTDIKYFISKHTGSII